MTPLFDVTPFIHLLYYGLGLLVFLAIGYFFGLLQSREWGDRRVEKSRNFQRGILKGTISEQLAPYLQGFPEDLKPSEARFLGKPVDFIVFKGIDENDISEVVFVEVKSGRHYLNRNESSLRRAIDEKRVRYVPYQVPKEIFTQE